MVSVLQEKIGKVGQRGQITLDLELVGKTVRISKLKDGKYIVEEVVAVPKNEAWFYKSENKKIFKKAIKSINKSTSKTIKSEKELDLFFSRIVK